jgi:SAM-dependent methyltransferase
MRYAQWFDRDEYELVYKQRNEREAEQVIDLLEHMVQPRPGAAILDMGCGRGRHSRSLTRRGYHVTGVDLSERALAQARTRAAAEGLDIDFRRGDMREPVCEACFDGVVNLFTAFGYFDDDAEHARTLHALATALKPGGWLFQDFLNASYVRANLVPETHRTEGEIEISERRWIEAGRINKEITLRRNGEEHTFKESVRLLTPGDLSTFYAEAGLDLRATYGTYTGDPHTAASPRLILYALK